jgi:putative transposase
LVWCPKYRRAVLTSEGISERLRGLLHEVAKFHGWEIVALEILPEHLGMIVKTPPVDAPHYVVRQFKSFTSRALRKEFPELAKKLPSLWTRSYYCKSLGDVSEKEVEQYLRDQKGK